MTITWGERIARLLRERGILKYLPWRFLRGYVYPLFQPRDRVAYDGLRFWSQWYTGDVSDARTISSAIRDDEARYHYAITEAAIITALYRDPPRAPRVLDIGTGAGHWIEFSRSAYGARAVVAIDISEQAIEHLEQRYHGEPSVKVLCASAVDSLPDGDYDLVIAIGVMFHIVDDRDWERALGAISHVLRVGARAVIGGEFGLWTHDAQVHREDGRWLVNKRLRSLRQWARAARRVGLRIERVVRTKPSPEIVTPQNNILVLVREADAPAS